jgi:hypothetical protein
VDRGSYLLADDGLADDSHARIQNLAIHGPARKLNWPLLRLLVVYLLLECLVVVWLVNAFG